ncbi:MAG: hypothetical protein IJJ70_02100 [Treponema sp.]|nr:hypothetical protein [Treponema sp.]MBR0486483.1 hypothetical protein [Treponema sp.]
MRNPRNHIFYVRYKDGSTLSTGQIQINKAVEFAEKNLIDRTPQKTDLHYLLTHYYLKDSKYVAYDRSHGITLDDKAVKSAFFRMIKIGELLPDCRTYKDVTRSRLIRLQEQLKELNFSAKTINNYMTANITKIEVVNGKDTDLHIDKPVYAIHLSDVKEL